MQPTFWALTLALLLVSCSSAETAPKGEWPGRLGLSGVNGDPMIDRASVEAFCTWRGRDCSVAHVFTNRSDWSSMTGGSGWMFDNFAGFAGKLVISQGLAPDGGDWFRDREHVDPSEWPSGPNPDMIACAQGEYDQHWHDFARLMIEHGRADSIVRLGWEFNGTYSAWSATDPALWKACYRRAAQAIRSVNPDVLLDWTINGHETAPETCDGASANCYPGDDVVDIIGIDNYDMGPSASSKLEFDRIAAGPDGLDGIYAFAQEHGKPLSIGEWGITPGSEFNTSGENPEFIRWMHDWFRAHADGIAYEMYFSTCDDVGSNLSRPQGPNCERRSAQAAKVYLSLFGD